MDKYHDITSDLDPREILRYLNHLGIHNVSGQVLKYFITDLKKLIKYDLQQKKENQNNEEREGPERLHSATTFSSRIRSKPQNGIILSCSRECRKSRNPLTIRNIHSAPNLPTRTTEVRPLRRACSCVREPKNPETLSKESKVTTTTSNNLIKVPIQAAKKKCDPVALYHYYTTLWAKYKSNVPGENNWADLRWNIRQKMAGAVTQQQSLHKVPELNLKVRDGQDKKNTKIL